MKPAPSSLPANRPAAAPFIAIAKPIGPICNLRCEYCFYLDKTSLFPTTRSYRMSEGVLEAFVSQYIASQPAGVTEVQFIWQGGEPTLMGVKFFQQAVDWQQKYRRPGMQVSNSLQTNGTLLDEDWGHFLHDHHFLVGISLDGPERLHNRYRLDAKGKGSFLSVIQGLEMLKRHEVEFNILTVVQNHNGDYPELIYDFLKGQGANYLQFIPIVEPGVDGSVSHRSVAPEQYGNFLNRIFDHWLEQNDVGKIFVQDFDMFLGLVMGLPSSVCIHADVCGRAVVIEHNGDFFSCDHFVDRDHRVGNILHESMSTLLDSPPQRRFGLDKRDTLPRCCRECEFLYVCHGGCPKDRLVPRPDIEPGLNYLCSGYKRFFQHTLPILEKMAKCLRTGRPASEYTNIEARVRADIKATGRQVGRNDPCPCGSGRKYKHCCTPGN